MIEEIEEQSERFAQEAVDQDFTWKDNEFSWVRQCEIKKRVKATIADLKFESINREIHVSKVNRENIELKVEVAELKNIITELRKKYE